MSSSCFMGKYLHGKEGRHCNDSKEAQRSSRDSDPDRGSHFLLRRVHALLLMDRPETTRTIYTVHICRICYKNLLKHKPLELSEPRWRDWRQFSSKRCTYGVRGGNSTVNTWSDLPSVSIAQSAGNHLLNEIITEIRLWNDGLTEP